MKKSIVYLVLGLIIGALAMFVFAWQTSYLQDTLCPKPDPAKEVWKNVEFPEYENPFEETTVNPFEEVYTNPFEKLEEAE